MERLLFGQEVDTPPITREASFSDMKSLQGTYTLPSGGQLLLQTDSDHLTLTAAGQDAVNSVFSLSNENTTELNDLARRTAKMVKAVLEGDLEHCTKELDDEERIKGWRRLLLDRLNIMKSKEDQTKINILGGLTWPRSEDTMEIVIEAKHDKNEVKFGLLWRKGKLWGLTTGPDTFTMRVLPVSRSLYAGYDLGTAKNAKLTFETDKQSRVIGLIIHGKTGNVKASKA